MAVPTTTNYQLLIPTPLDPSGANAWGPWVNSNTSFADGYYFSLAGNFIGNSAPTIPATSLPTNGQFWINNTSSPWLLNVYDGTQWLEIGAIDPTAHTWTPVGPTPLLSSMNIQTFTTSGTYTPSSGMVQCIIEIVAGGGGGGGSFSTGGGGGGAGEYAKGLFTAAQIGVSQTVTIGAAGSGASSATSNGTAGGTTSVGSLITALPGSFGASNNHSSATSTGGAGGSGGTGGQLRIPGQAGGYGFDIGSVVSGGSGPGGNTFFGYGGVGINTAVGSSVNGANGVGYGSGGSGGMGSSSSAAGGNGAPGYVIITEYIQS